MKTMILSQYDFISIWLRHFSASFGRILCIGLFLSVSACGGSGGGGGESGGGGGNTTAPPTAPTGLKVVNANTSEITLNWDAGSGGDYYEIYRSISTSETTRTKINDKITSTAISFVDKADFAADTIYYYWLKYCKTGEICSGFSNVADAIIKTPTAPTGLKAVENTASKITLNWDTGSEGDYYEIYRSISASRTTDAKPIASPLASAGTKFVDTGVTVVTADVTYYYWLKYCKSGGICSGFSNAANAIIKLSRKCPNGEQPCVVTIAGPTEQDGSAGYKDGTAEDARFTFPFGITLGPDGNLYVADAINNRIRKVTALGVVSTFAGNDTNDTIDGTGIKASFKFPRGLMLDKTGKNFYTGGAGNKIRKITPEGVVTTLNADLGMTIMGLTGDASGNIYAILTDKTVRRINLKTGEEVAKSEALPNPTNFAGVVIGPEGKYLYATDQQTIYKMELPLTNDKIFTRIAGGIGNVDGNLFKDGTGDEARFNNPSQLVFDKGGNLYIAEYNNNRIRKLSFDKDGKVTVSTLAGTGAQDHKDASGIIRVRDGAAKTATFASPAGIAYDKDDHLFYVSEYAGNRIRKIVLPY